MARIVEFASFGAPEVLEFKDVTGTLRLASALARCRRFATGTAVVASRAVLRISNPARSLVGGSHRTLI